MQTYLYWGEGMPFESQVSVASSSSEPTVRSLGSIRHFGPLKDL